MFRDLPERLQGQLYERLEPRSQPSNAPDDAFGPDAEFRGPFCGPRGGLVDGHQ